MDTKPAPHDRGASYKLLEALKRQAAKIGGANVNIALPGTEDWINISFGRNVVRTASGNRTDRRSLR